MKSCCLRSQSTLTRRRAPFFLPWNLQVVTLTYHFPVTSCQLPLRFWNWNPTDHGRIRICSSVRGVPCVSRLPKCQWRSRRGIQHFLVFFFRALERLADSFRRKLQFAKDRTFCQYSYPDPRSLVNTQRHHKSSLVTVIRQDEEVSACFKSRHEQS